MLTARDEALLRALNRFRFARSSDLRRLFFAGASPGRAAERLRQLFWAGYLDVRVGKLSEENVYALGPRGRGQLELHGVALGRLPVGGLNHHLAIVSAWARLVEGVQLRDDLRLKLFRPDWEIRALGQALPVVPDAIAEIAGHEQMLRVALEVDLATERSPALKRKFEAYRELEWHARESWGWSEMRLVVLVGAGGERRRAVLQRFIEPAGLALGMHEWPEALWRLVPTPPLTDPVYSKRGESAPSDAVIEDSSTESAGLSREEGGPGALPHD